MRRFPIVPGQQGGSFAQTIVMPPAVAPVECPPCGTVAEWKDLKEIAAVTVEPKAGSAAAYADGVYTIAHGTGEFQDAGQWNISVDDSNLPVVCRLVLITGSFENSNIATMFTGTADNATGYYLKFNIGGVTINVNFSIFPGQPIILTYAMLTDGDYETTTFRIEFISTT